ncbi:bifunctional diaminohydroxyphosphoribosylaminopyrimidine deaminase/5-amino-6-(5-phosphoribosylamino)uracil reductase RibD [Stagnimonas aquatica]|uniref:Riboflavin biosynthesis protein RibD n=2 Tax=Stagnimonas aquatica TaxID=2689987 RepID=A0A3N0V8P8_9GAMM|nr:bifunctional diaminohydroxyphosphoribosylaminopyrimidine deaminase/5-amino-6-(5-phosphoribosylamino)uracil reductase RibD [Stagnimonas aquatica]
MARALRLAEAGRYSSHPNPRVGCVLWRDGEIVGEGAHLRAGEPHAEVHALRQAGERARGATAFVSLEPCNHHGRTPPCTEALIAAGVSRVVAAMEDPNPLVAGQGLARLRAAGIAVEVGLLQADAERLNRGFVSRMRRQRPFLILKLAASLDGRTAMASGESQWITGAEARADVHRLRAEAGAVLTSSDTVLADDPALTVRLPADYWAGRGLAIPGATGRGSPAAPTASLASHAGGDNAIHGAVAGLRQPDRIVLDSRARVPASAKVWAEGARRFRVTTAAHAAAPVAAGVESLAVEPDASGHISLPALLPLLAQRGVNELLVECGPRLAGALLASGLVDELLLYLAPALLGHEGRALADLPGLQRLDQKIALRYIDVRQVGRDLRILATPEPLSPPPRAGEG